MIFYNPSLARWLIKPFRAALYKQKYLNILNDDMIPYYKRSTRLAMESKTCKKCGKTSAKWYQVGIILKEKSEYVGLISMYRCYCSFCEGCLENVKKLHPDNIYIPLNENGKMPSPSPYHDELHNLFHVMMKCLDGEQTEFKSTLRKIALDAIEPATLLYQKWLIETFHQQK